MFQKNMKEKNKKIISVLILSLALFLGPVVVSALEIQTIDNVQVESDIVLGPGKVEIFLDPGETEVRRLKINNRSGRVLDFTVEVEDFTGSEDGGAKLLGKEEGPYSLRDYLRPEVNNFQLAHGEKAFLDVKISIPQDAEPGGYYGSVLVSAKGAEIDNSLKGGQINIRTRLGTLFFVRVKGDVEESGFLKKFGVDKKFNTSGDINFGIDYENTGSVHQTPYGTITIANLMGKTVDVIDMDPWFVMPGFSRLREVKWVKSLTFGLYTANLELHRNYDGLVDESKVSFWIIPVKTLVIFLAIVILLTIFVVWFSNKFELKKKK
jgi:hypothetical protein